MADNSKIEWTDTTWNPVRGCSRVSKGCENCYAERQAGRFSGPGLPYEGLVRPSGQWNGKIRCLPEKLDEPLRWRKPRRVFVNSMSDLFHAGVSPDFIDRVFLTMSLASQHTFQILTKRPRAMRDYVRFCHVLRNVQLYQWISNGGAWPPPNVQFGVSVEDQPTADERIPLLLDMPAAVRFVSYEPALGPVDFRNIAWAGVLEHTRTNALRHGWVARNGEVKEWRALDWIVVGGESGPCARQCDVEWIRSAVRQCKNAGVPVFVKQIGSNVWDRNDRCYEADIEVDAATGEWTERDGWPHWVTPMPDSGAAFQGALCRVKTHSSLKGGDPDEWPLDLRVREFPGGGR